MKPILALLLVLQILVALTRPASAAPAEIDTLVNDYLAKRPTKALRPGLSMAEALKLQTTFVDRLTPKLGPRVGYKVGLVAKATQERYGVNAPVRGVLLRDMLLQNRAEVPATFGARPLFEADLIVVIKDSGIHSARTPLEAAQHLSEIVAFIELPDALADPAERMDGPRLTAYNVGARSGVLGERTKVQPTAEFVNAFGEMKVVLTDQTGKELVNAKASVIMGHPLNALLWLIKDLESTGEKLKPGDLISLGSMAPPIPVTAGQSISMVYEGLPGGPLRVSARFK